MEPVIPMATAALIKATIIPLPLLLPTLSHLTAAAPDTNPTGREDKTTPETVELEHLLQREHCHAGMTLHRPTRLIVPRTLYCAVPSPLPYGPPPTEVLALSRRNTPLARRRRSPNHLWSVSPDSWVEAAEKEKPESRQLSPPPHHQRDNRPNEKGNDKNDDKDTWKSAILIVSEMLPHRTLLS